MFLNKNISALDDIIAIKKKTNFYQRKKIENNDNEFDSFFAEFSNLDVVSDFKSLFQYQKLSDFNVLSAMCLKKSFFNKEFLNMLEIFLESQFNELKRTTKYDYNYKSLNCSKIQVKN